MPSGTNTSKLLPLCVLVCTLVVTAHAHGRMVLPPSRATAWRLGVPGAPVDYNDNQAFCGGRTHQHVVNGGKCGICGDPWDQHPRDHERPDGKFVMRTDYILSTFREGQVLEASVQLTTAHLGYFEFYLCDVDSLPGHAEEATPECLKQHRLFNLNNGSYRYTFTRNVAMTHQIRLQLPPGLTCSHCVLQWKYHTGNSWHKGCLGCGDQEEFYSCSDLRILAKNQPMPTTTKAPPARWTTAAPVAKQTTTHPYIPAGVDPNPLTEQDKEFFLCNFCFSNRQITGMYPPVCLNFGFPYRRCSRLGK